MVLWALNILVLALALSIARSHLAFPMRAVFLTFHALGLLMGAIYIKKTPDLYPHNAHHGFGWWLTTVVLFQALLGLVHLYQDSSRRRRHGNDDEERVTFLPISVATMAKRQQIQGNTPPSAYRFRFSHDSGHGNECTSSPLPTRSPAFPENRFNRRLKETSLLNNNHPDEEEDGWREEGVDGEKTLPDRPWWIRSWMTSPRIAIVKVAKHVHRVGRLVYDLTDRLLLPLGFVGIATGIVVYGGIFVSFLPPLRLLSGTPRSPCGLTFNSHT